MAHDCGEWWHDARMVTVAMMYWLCAMAEPSIQDGTVLCGVTQMAARHFPGRAGGGEVPSRAESRGFPTSSMTTVVM